MLNNSQNRLNNCLNNPLVSIGLPVYNGEMYISRSINSILAQKYDNLELIISDNCSTDSTTEICKRYAEIDPRIKLTVNECNIGAFPNFLIALNKSSGKYFMFAAVDDFWAPQYLTTMVNELELHPECDLVRCASERFNEDGSKFDIVQFFDNENINDMSQFKLVFRAVSSENVCYYIYGLFRTECIKSLFNKKIPQVFGADFLFIIHVFMSSRVRYVDKILSSIQLHQKPISERYSDSEDGKLHGTRFRYCKMAIQLGPYLLLSPIIPQSKKTWIPILVIKQLFWAMIRDGLLRIPIGLFISVRTFVRKVTNSNVR